ncbi:MAG: hypothetical protein KAJ14_09360 [Candidatus Omnitrophica bacterium]|nr:hypothetical protein [Candidatus Omnitrophota bacterium]
MALRVYHWLIMSNHYQLDEPERISSVMARIGRSYACYHHRKYKSAGYLWQGRFKSQPIQKELYLIGWRTVYSEESSKSGYS